MTDTTSLWPQTLVESIWLWNALLGRLEATQPLVRPALLCIRGVKPFAAESHPLEHVMHYDDCFVFVAPGDNPLVFPAATHAYQRTSSASPKFDGDKLGAVGSIRPGRYLLTDKRNGAEVVFHITNPDGSDGLPAWRDFDHDGKLTPAEMQRSEDMRTGQQVGNSGTLAYSILWHGGPEEPPKADGTPADHHYSIGCFTAERKYRQLVSDKCRAHHGKADLFLVTVEELMGIRAGLPRIDDEPAGSVA